MSRSPRNLNHALTWFEQRNCYRFRYRDPYDGKAKYLYCTPSRFEEAGIELADPSVIRRKTKRAEGLAKRLRSAFLSSLASIRLEKGTTEVPLLTEAIEIYFGLYEQSEGYRKTLRSIFEEFTEVAGDKPIDEVSDRDLKAYKVRLAARVKTETVRSYLKQLSMLLGFAVKKGWVSRDPRVTYKLPRAQPELPDPYSLPDLKDLFAFFETTVPGRSHGWDHAAWAAAGMLTLGLRPIELEHARWENVDWKERFLFIERSHPNKEPQACQNQPIPLAIWPLFEERRKEEGLIWTTQRGGAWTKDSRARARRSIQKKFSDFQWKRFRTTFATLLQQAGNDVLLVSRLLRHAAGGKNVTVAQRHYIGQDHHYLREVVDEAFKTLAGLGPFPSAAERGRPRLSLLRRDA